MTKEQLNKRIKSIISDAGRLEEAVRIMEAVDPELKLYFGCGSDLSADR